MKSNRSIFSDTESEIYTLDENSQVNSNDTTGLNSSCDYVAFIDDGDETSHNKISGTNIHSEKDITSYLEAVKLVGSNYIPTALSRIINMFNGPASTLILSHYDSGLLAISSLASAEQLLVVTIPSMLIYGTSPVIGKICGAAEEGDNSNQNVSIIVHSSMLASLALSVPIMIVLSYSEKLLLALQQETGNVTLIQEYFNAYRWGVPALLFTISSQQLAAGLKLYCFVQVQHPGFRRDAAAAGRKEELLETPNRPWTRLCVFVMLVRGGLYGLYGGQTEIT